LHDGGLSRRNRRVDLRERRVAVSTNVGESHIRVDR
jgi:hypothetical protein